MHLSIKIRIPRIKWQEPVTWFLKFWNYFILILAELNLMRSPNFAKTLPTLSKTGKQISQKMYRVSKLAKKLPKLAQKGPKSAILQNNREHVCSSSNSITFVLL